MKQAWNDLKSFVTIVFTITIVALIIILAIQQNWEIFKLVFNDCFWKKKNILYNFLVLRRILLWQLDVLHVVNS